MADIAFLLIIYFMVTTTFAATRGLDFRLPEVDDVITVDRVESVHVEVHGNRSLTVDSQTLELHELLEYLRPRLRENPEKPVIVHTDADAPYGAMVDVLDELRQGRAKLELDEEIVISVPTRREIETYWR